MNFYYVYYIYILKYMYYFMNFKSFHLFTSATMIHRKMHTEQQFTNHFITKSNNHY